jgi:hypothetical protein
MSDEIKTAGCGCYDPCDDDNEWLEWIIIIVVVFWIFNGGFGKFFGRGCR